MLNDSVEAGQTQTRNTRWIKNNNSNYKDYNIEILIVLSVLQNIFTTFITLRRIGGPSLQKLKLNKRINNKKM